MVVSVGPAPSIASSPGSVGSSGPAEESLSSYVPFGTFTTTVLPRLLAASTAARSEQRWLDWLSMHFVPVDDLSG